MIYYYNICEIDRVICDSYKEYKDELYIKMVAQYYYDKYISLCNNNIEDPLIIQQACYLLSLKYLLDNPPLVSDYCKIVCCSNDRLVKAEKDIVYKMDYKFAVDIYDNTILNPLKKTKNKKSLEIDNKIKLKGNNNNKDNINMNPQQVQMIKIDAFVDKYNLNNEGREELMTLFAESFAHVAMNMLSMPKVEDFVSLKKKKTTDKPKCKGKTKNGDPCRRSAKEGTEYCGPHQPKEEDKIDPNKPKCNGIQMNGEPCLKQTGLSIPDNSEKHYCKKHIKKWEDYEGQEEDDKKDEEEVKLTKEQLEEMKQNGIDNKEDYLKSVEIYEKRLQVLEENGEGEAKKWVKKNMIKKDDIKEPENLSPDDEQDQPKDDEPKEDIVPPAEPKEEPVKQRRPRVRRNVVNK